MKPRCRLITDEDRAYEARRMWASHQCGCRQREWASAGQALLVLVTAPVWLVGWALALLAEHKR
jgi:hypothetical protein